MGDTETPISATTSDKKLQRRLLFLLCFEDGGPRLLPRDPEGKGSDRTLVSMVATSFRLPVD